MNLVLSPMHLNQSTISSLAATPEAENKRMSRAGRRNIIPSEDLMMCDWSQDGHMDDVRFAPVPDHSPGGSIATTESFLVVDAPMGADISSSPPPNAQPDPVTPVAPPMKAIPTSTLVFPQPPAAVPLPKAPTGKRNRFQK